MNYISSFKCAQAAWEGKETRASRVKKGLADQSARKGAVDHQVLPAILARSAIRVCPDRQAIVGRRVYSVRLVLVVTRVRSDHVSASPDNWAASAKVDEFATSYEYIDRHMTIIIPYKNLHFSVWNFWLSQLNLSI